MWTMADILVLVHFPVLLLLAGFTLHTSAYQCSEMMWSFVGASVTWWANLVLLCALTLYVASAWFVLPAVMLAGLQGYFFIDPFVRGPLPLLCGGIDPAIVLALCLGGIVMAVVLVMAFLCLIPRVHEECSICLEDFGPKVFLSRLPCDHTFHRRCIRRWAKRNARCPVCSRPIK